MSIVRFDPFSRTVRELDRLTGEMLGGRAVAGPDYDIEDLGENRFAVALAVPGYAENELEITVKDRELVVSGKPQKLEGKQPSYVRRGIGKPAFARTFTLGEHVEIVTARLVHGILRIELERRLPDAKKPRTIAIEGADEAVAGSDEANAGEQQAA